MKIIHTIYPIIFIVVLLGCAGREAFKKNSQASGVKFASVSNHYNTQTLIVPEEAQVDIIYRGAADSVMTDEGIMRLSKNKIDFLAYVPMDGSNEHGQLFMNHELRDSNSVLGDGGGMSWLEIKKINGQWKQMGEAHDIDFAHLGGTWHNCGGEVSPHGTILTAEEYPPFSNEELYHQGTHFRDTSDFKGLKRNENLGWIVEVDIATKKPLHKLWHLGRFSHEDTYSTPDGKTVYLTDDYSPCVFFKFEAAIPNDYTKGQLYAYKQSEDGLSGKWLALPMVMDSLIHARDVAIRLGATMFKSHEWIDEYQGKIYISESGGSFDYSQGVSQGGTMPHYYKSAPLGIGSYKTKDWFGRILVFDPSSNKMEVFLEGGKMPDGGYFSTPDGLEIVEIQGKPYLFVCEDTSVDQLVEAKIESYKQKKTYLELYMIPIVKDGMVDKEGIKRLAIGPKGCEMTGLAFTPDRQTLFLTVQHPSKDNPLPFNTCTIVALTKIFND
ncbi:MAG: DUF839 domain-containing protein [Microscillaceae bacterium]|nr:DUF839 domain-containing protein [Microscillaceae bacterium]